MQAEIIVGRGNDTDRFIGWVPTPAKVRLVDAGGADEAVAVVLRNHNDRGGQVIFFSAIPGDAQEELTATLPLNGTPAELHISGRFKFPSTADGDAGIDVVNVATGQVIGTTPLMVRVRKDATKLTPAERNRFLFALAKFNDGGRGRFSDFRNVHTSAGDPEAHSRAGFLPWHRSFLLDLERELQNIDPTVALPYWKFDQPARKLFNRDFIGTSSSTGTVQFSPTNPLQNWATDGTVPGIDRTPFFNTSTQSAFVSSELTTLGLGGPGKEFVRFRAMEGDPHGDAHTSFSGSISDIPTACKDPLFFLLHANVDRLWAKWQWLNAKFDLSDVKTYTFLGAAGDPGSTRIGHNLKDTMWPWNQEDVPPRPPTAPGGTMALSPQVAGPGLTPTVGSMIDYQGVLQSASKLGFDYDDVPFEFVEQR
jgi:tyrosinase